MAGFLKKESGFFIDISDIMLYHRYNSWNAGKPLAFFEVYEGCGG